MHKGMPPLTALRAFEAAARHLSLTRAARELHVTPGALSHQIRGLEEMLGVLLFERRVRSIALTPAGKLLYPGLQTGFTHIREAVAGLDAVRPERVLVISTPPGFTSKWLAPRLYRFSGAHPEIDARVSSSKAYADFITDGVDVAVRNLPIRYDDDPMLMIEKLIEVQLVPVCSPRLLAEHGPIAGPQSLAHLPLIHDDTLAGADVPGWAEWFAAAGVAGVDVRRGLRFDSADHALDATLEGAGVLLAHDILAYDDLRTGRLVVPVSGALQANRAYHFVCARSRREHPHVRTFRDWLTHEMAALDWSTIAGGHVSARRQRPDVHRKRSARRVSTSSRSAG